jgi:1-acyl-sn-glycerol-3-phosphate acyltransferase
VGAYYSASRFLVSVVLGVLSRPEVKGKEHIPRSGGLVIACNHISYWDPPLVGAAFTREAHYLAKEELFSKPILGPMIRSVNSIPIRRGAADLSGLSKAIEAVRRGKVLVLFPEGSRMRDGALHPARPGLGLIAVQADARIVPCYISGSNQPARWLLGRTRVRIWFGPARHWREFAGVDADLAPGRALYQRLGERVMQEIAHLKNEQETSASRGAA